MQLRQFKDKLQNKPIIIAQLTHGNVLKYGKLTNSPAKIVEVAMDIEVLYVWKSSILAD